MDETKDWVVVGLRSGAYRLVRAVVLPVGGHGSVLVPHVSDDESAEIARVANAPTWQGSKRPARFSSGLACIRCAGSRRSGGLPVALLSRGGNAFVAVIRPGAAAWEFLFRPLAAALPSGAPQPGSAATAEAAFDAIVALAAAGGFDVDPRPSPVLDADA